MQLDYWTNKAQIPTKGKKQRIYDIDAVETVMLIKQGKDKGLSLSTAIEAAQQVQGRARAPRRVPRRPPALLGLAQNAGGRLGRHRVHEVAGAELEACEDSRGAGRSPGASGPPAWSQMFRETAPSRDL